MGAELDKLDEVEGSSEDSLEVDPLEVASLTGACVGVTAEVWTGTSEVVATTEAAVVAATPTGTVPVM